MHVPGFVIIHMNLSYLQVAGQVCTVLHYTILLVQVIGASFIILAQGSFSSVMMLSCYCRNIIMRVAHMQSLAAAGYCPVFACPGWSVQSALSQTGPTHDMNSKLMELPIARRDIPR